MRRMTRACFLQARNRTNCVGSCRNRELGDRLPAPRDCITITGRGTVHDHPRFIRSPRDVAAGIVVLELQRRGLFHTAYAGATLRQTLGLGRPAVGAWR